VFSKTDDSTNYDSASKIERKDDFIIGLCRMERECG
jgi:hypothetical protein